MTYLPIRPVGSTANAGPLSDDNLFPVTQSGISRETTLATLKAFVGVGSTGSTGTTGGSTGTTGGSTGGTTGSTGGGSTGSTGGSTGGSAGAVAVTKAVPNTSATPAAVTFPAPSVKAKTVTAAVGNESAQGTTINAGDTTSITTSNGDVLTLVNGGSSRGYYLAVNGVDHNNSDHIQKVKYWNHSAYHYYVGNDDNGTAAWFYLLPSSNYDGFIQGDDPEVMDTVPEPVAPTGLPPYGLGHHLGNGDDSGKDFYNAQAAVFLRAIGTPQYVGAFTPFNQEWNTWAGSSTPGNYKSNQYVGNCIPVVGIKLTRNYCAYSSNTESFEGDTLDSTNYGNNNVCSLIWDGQNDQYGNHRPNHFQMDNTFASGRSGIAYYSELNGTYTQVAGTDTPGVSRVVYTGRTVNYQDTNGSWFKWNGSGGFTSVSDPLPSNYVRVECYRHQNNRDFVDVANGVHDADITAVANAWLYYYDKVYFRIAYEMDGGFMPDFLGDDPNDTVTLPRWIAAFKRMSTVLKAAATAAGKTIKICWNPNVGGYNSHVDTRDSYPGSDYVDVIGLDCYSPCYNGTGSTGRSDWGNNAPFTYLPTQKAWLADPRNRMQQWDYQGCDAYNPQSSTAATPFQEMLTFAISKGKPLAMCETGAGTDYGGLTRNGGISVGPIDENAFPYWLRSRLDQFVNMGGRIEFLIIWGTNESDGGWGVTQGQRPKALEAWSNAFGGTGNAPLTYNPKTNAGTTSGSTGSSSGSTGSMGGSTGTGTSSGSAGPATVIVTDTAGKSVTLSLPNPPQPNNGSFQTFYGSDTGLATNVNWFTGQDGNLYLDGSSDSVIASAAVTKNGVPVVSLMPNTTYTGTSSATGGGSSSTAGPATAIVTDTSGKSATLSLSNPPQPNNGSFQTFYGSDTGLATNVNWFVGTDGNLYLDGSSDGVVASVAVTKNGVPVVSLMPNTSYN